MSNGRRSEATPERSECATRAASALRATAAKAERGLEEERLPAVASAEAGVEESEGRSPSDLR